MERKTRENTTSRPGTEENIVRLDNEDVRNAKNEDDRGGRGPSALCTTLEKSGLSAPRVMCLARHLCVRVPRVLE